jgi:hypothetical protein
MSRFITRPFFVFTALSVFIACPALMVAAQAEPVQEAVKAEAAAAPAEPETAPAEEKEEAQDQEALAEQKGAAKKTYDMVSGIVEKLKPEEQKHFFMIYNNYNLIDTVKVVQTDVGKAIDGCAGNNPEMTDELRSRFKGWNDAVNPLIKDAEANMNNMVLAQDYLPENEFKKVFKSVDDTRKKSNSRIEKIPVTSKDACEYLLGKMDETQGSMLALLKSTLITFPQMFPNAENADQNPKEESAPEQAPEKAEKPADTDENL